MTTITRTAICAFAVFASATNVNAEAYNVTFNDVVNNTNVGFDHPTLGATRRGTIDSVFLYLDSVLDEPGDMDIVFKNSETDGSGFLASAGPLFFTGPNGFQGGLAATHLQTGTDPSAGNPDANSTFDFGYNWNSDTGTPTGSEFDLFTVALHEITHALGFLSLLTSAGLSDITDSDPGVFSTFDSFLELGDGTDLFAAGGDFLGSASDLVSDDIFFGGANATAANGGSAVKMYAPTTFASGSSLSHVFASTNMNFAVAPGVQRRTYSNVELGILQDIGYTLTAGATPVPEPTSWLLMLGGLGVIVARRRRR